MFKQIFKAIKKYDNIVIARHIGVDPDAMASQLGLRDAIRLTFPNKNVYAVGVGGGKFPFLGSLDHFDGDYSNTLLIITDTPDKRRVDCENIDSFAYKIKIDHHPYVETFCDIEYIDDTASSACELIMRMIYDTKLKANTDIMEKLFQGLVSDTNRFLFSNSKYTTFEMVSRILKDYNLEITNLYANLMMRPLSEIKLQGYMIDNMRVTDNGVGYMIITDEILKKYEVDVASPGNLINNFNYINEVFVWLAITEDKKNGLFKANIRSRGPVINEVAERYNGGGHKMASGAKMKTMEEVNALIQELDKETEKYLKENGDSNED